jgi:hypothetical protein
MIRTRGSAVRSGVIGYSTPNHPLRLAGIFAASAAFFAIVAGAVLAVTYVVQDVRSPARTSAVLGADAVPKQSDLNLPKGVIALQSVTDADAFEQLAGFKPFVPKQLPDHTRNDVSLSVALPDDKGVRAGRVGFSPNDAAGPGGITGPLVVLWETQGTPDASADGTFAPVMGGKGRAMVATIGCGSRALTIRVELFFNPSPAPGEPYVTPYMTDTAQTFGDGLKKQCGG